MSNVVVLMQSHDDTFVSGLIAHCGDAPYRHQDIRLRIVGCRTSQGNGVRNDDEVVRFANFAVRYSTSQECPQPLDKLYQSWSH
jgi:hypothetical protein